MGTPEFARVILEQLHNAQFNIMAVFAQPDKPAGRGKKMQSPAVAVYAHDNNLKLYQPVRLKTPEMTGIITELKPDYIIVAAYGKILSQAVLNAARIDCLNVHASLLPLYRGAAPINHALLDGQTETGISIMRVVDKLDAGAVFSRHAIKITAEDDAITLTDKLSRIGARALIETLDKIHGAGLQPIEQAHARATYAPKLNRDLSPVSWSNTAGTIFNQVRALLPWPVATASLKGAVLKVYKTEVLTTTSAGEPGTLVHLGRTGWTIKTGSTDLLIKEVQLEGKKRMGSFDLANGLRLKAGERL